MPLFFSSNTLPFDCSTPIFFDDYGELVRSKTKCEKSKLSNKRHVELSISNSSALHRSSPPLYFTLRRPTATGDEVEEPLNNFIEEESGKKIFCYNFDYFVIL